jgi:hypothetical protein
MFSIIYLNISIHLFRISSDEAFKNIVSLVVSITKGKLLLSPYNSKNDNTLRYELSGFFHFLL